VYNASRDNLGHDHFGVPIVRQQAARDLLGEAFLGTLMIDDKRV
jgi:hypothetical protein